MAHQHSADKKTISYHRRILEKSQGVNNQQQKYKIKCKIKDKVGFKNELKNKINDVLIVAAFKRY